MSEKNEVFTVSLEGVLDTPPMRIAVYGIAKDEEDNVQQWAQSCAEADVRIIVDTGSTDATVERAHETGVAVHKKIFDPWRFDVARNYSLSLIPDDVDLCISLDLDEVLVPGWREALESASTPEATRYRYLYTWSWNIDGTPGLQYAGDKIHTRHGYRWQYPVHEVLIPLGGEHQQWSDAEIHHHRDQDKSRDQYLPLLEVAVAENLDDDRNAHYLAREYMYNERFSEASAEFKRHLALPTATWKAERAQSLRYLAVCEPELAEQWLSLAIETDPERREPWVDLGYHYFQQEQWAECLAACEEGLKLQRRPLEYLTEAQAWGGRLDDMAANACFWMNEWERAVTFGESAVNAEPSDYRLQVNLKRYRDTVARWENARVAVPEGFEWRRLPTESVVEVLPPDDMPDGWAIMNPSIATDGSHMRMTVRCVNYRLAVDEYVMAHDDEAIKTRTGLMDVDDTGASRHWRWIDDSAALTLEPQYPVYGVEDMRLFSHHKTWMTIGAVRDFSSTGAIRQVLSELRGEDKPALVAPWRMSSPLFPDDDTRAYEKNWVIDTQAPQGIGTIWSTEPFISLRLDSLTQQIIPITGRPNQLSSHDLRGSTPVFQTPDGPVYVVHRVGPSINQPHRPRRTYLHAFVRLCGDHVHVGNFWILQELGLEYIAGGCVKDSKLYLSFGRDDARALVAVCSWSEVRELVPPSCANVSSEEMTSR